MRTTLDIEDDILQAAKEMAKREGSTAGKVISALARVGLKGGVQVKHVSPKLRNGVPILPTRGEIVTVEHVLELMDQEGV